MTTLHDFYHFICIHVPEPKKGGKIPLMTENDFFDSIFTGQMKSDYPFLLNFRHHTFRPEDFNALAEKKKSSQPYRQSLLLYFMCHLSAIDGLEKNCRDFLSVHFPHMHRNRYLDGTKRWIFQLDLSRKDPLRTYLEGNDLSVSILQLCSRRMTWMLLDALGTYPNDLCLLYRKYASASGQSVSGISALKCISGLRRLYNHAAAVLNEKNKEKQLSGYFSLAQEFGRLQTMYQQTQNSFTEEYRRLFQESFHYFYQFLEDLEKNSSTPFLNLNLLKKNLEQLRELENL